MSASRPVDPPRSFRPGCPSSRRRGRLGYALAALGLAARTRVRAKRRRRTADRRGRKQLYRLGDGPGAADPRPPPAGRDRGGHRDPARPRLAVLAGARPRGHRRRRRGGADAVDRAAPVRQLRHRVRPVRAALRPCLHRPREDRALRGPLPRLVGCDPLVGPPGPDDWGRRPRRRRRPARPACPTPSPARCWWPAGTTPPHSSACSSGTATRSPRSSPSRSSATAVGSCPRPATSSGCAS